MPSETKVKRIFLVGFRTTGKTTIGKLLAQKLNWSFWDCDFLITQESGQNIESLTKKGTDWTAFRKLENETLEEVSKLDNAVISCGGGVGVNDVLSQDSKTTFGELNRNILSSATDSLIILLTSDTSKIRQRLKRQYKNNKLMPFLITDNAKKMETEKDKNILIEKLIDDSIATYEKRKDLYDLLTKVKINTDSQSLEKTSEEILKYVR